MNTYLTKVRAINPQTGELDLYAGPNIYAADKKEARRILDATGLGYCEIIGRLVEVVDLSDIAEDPAPFALKMDFEFHLN